MGVLLGSVLLAPGNFIIPPLVCFHAPFHTLAWGGLGVGGMLNEGIALEWALCPAGRLSARNLRQSRPHTTCFLPPYQLQPVFQAYPRWSLVTPPPAVHALGKRAPSPPPARSGAWHLLLTSGTWRRGWEATSEIGHGRLGPPSLLADSPSPPLMTQMAVGGTEARGTEQRAATPGSRSGNPRETDAAATIRARARVPHQRSLRMRPQPGAFRVTSFQPHPGY